MAPSQTSIPGTMNALIPKNIAKSGKSETIKNHLITISSRNESTPGSSRLVLHILAKQKISNGWRGHRWEWSFSGFFSVPTTSLTDRHPNSANEASNCPTSRTASPGS